MAAAKQETLEQAKEYLEELIDIIKNYRAKPTALNDIKNAARAAYSSLTRANDELDQINRHQALLDEYIKEMLKTMEDKAKITRELARNSAGPTARAAVADQIFNDATMATTGLRARATTLQTDLKIMIKKAKTLNSRIISEFKKGNNALPKQPAQAIASSQNAIKYITQSKTIISGMAKQPTG